MKTYAVEWRIEIDAESPEDAARTALEIQRNPESLAAVFYVQEYDDVAGDWHLIDLAEDTNNA